VTSSAQLSAENAGSLSGSRQGNIVNLVLPKAKVSAGEWVSVFVFPGATTKGWVQVDDTNSVSIDISTLESGSYELAVADRDNSLLGWAKLEITSASFDPRNPAQAQLLTLPDDKEAQTPRGLSVNDMLLGGAGGLLAAAVSWSTRALPDSPLTAPSKRPPPRMALKAPPSSVGARAKSAPFVVPAGTSRMFAAAQAVPTASAPVSASKPNFFHFPLKTMSLLIRLELLRC